MRNVRRYLRLSEELRHPYQRAVWLLDAAEAYTDATVGLLRTLQHAVPASRLLQCFRDGLQTYVRSPQFATLTADSAHVRESLAGVRYCLHMTGTWVKVQPYGGEEDYGAEVLAVFDRFRQIDTSQRSEKQGATSRVRGPRELPDMNHVEEEVLDRVALLNPEVFQELRTYAERHVGFRAPGVVAFDREMQFYIAWDGFRARLRGAGLSFCYPEVSNETKNVAAQGTFDVALADRLVEAHRKVVPNDFHLEGPERVLVVSGPNQGGKTTLARTVGQLHHFAALGCPVPGRRAQLHLCDQLFTHFERGENLTDLSGKLHDDLDRVHAILDEATADSLVVLNEVFTSTTLDDAVLLGTRVLEKIIARDLLCVCVTFVEELASVSDATVSMVSTVDPDNPTERTFQVLRRPAQGRSHAMALADMYGLGYDRLSARLSERANVATGGAASAEMRAER